MSDEKKKRKSRKWIVKALIIFLIIMGILTFFSNTIMNMTLTQVSTQQVYPATLSSINRVSGTLHTVTEKQVKAAGDITIDNVNVYMYQEVMAGDVLATFALPEERADLDQAKKDLEDLVKKMEYDERSPSDSTDYYTLEMDVVDAEKAVEQAKKNLEASKNKDASIEQTQNAITELNKEISQIDRDKEILEGKQTELQQKVDTLGEQLNDARTALNQAREERDACPKDPSDPNYNKSRLDKANKAVSDAQAEINAIKPDYDKAVEDLNEVTGKVNSKSDELVEKQAALQEKETDLQEFQGLSTVEEAERALKDAQHSLQVAQKTLSDQKKNDSISRDQSKDDKEAEIKKLEDLKKEVKRLEDYYAVTDVKAPIDGMVIAINVNHGSQCGKDEVLFTIADLSSGFYVECPVDKKDAEAMRAGAEVRTDICDSAYVESMRPDPSDPMNSCIIRVSVTGDWVIPGQTVTCTISTSNHYYDNVVPKGAVQSDSDGDFIYILVTKNSPLGERYIARKVPVKKIAEDATSCAIEGTGVNYAYCIVRTEKPIKNGEQVRLAQGETN